MMWNFIACRIRRSILSETGNGPNIAREDRAALAIFAKLSLFLKFTHSKGISQWVLMNDQAKID